MGGSEACAVAVLATTSLAFLLLHGERQCVAVSAGHAASLTLLSHP